MELVEKTVSSQVEFTGRIITVRQDQAALPNGRVVGREVVEHPGGVAVLALFDDNTVPVVRQFRYPFQKIITELPAGKLDHGEDHRLAGIRELEEETGLTADSFEYMGGLLSSPGFSDEVLHLYLARGLHQGPCRPDPDEFLELQRVPFQELLEQAMDGRLQDAKTVAGLLKTKVLLGL